MSESVFIRVQHQATEFMLTGTTSKGKNFSKSAKMQTLFSYFKIKQSGQNYTALRGLKIKFVLRLQRLKSINKNQNIVTLKLDDILYSFLTFKPHN